jgi:hypothetical protein
MQFAFTIRRLVKGKCLEMTDLMGVRQPGTTGL